MTCHPQIANDHGQNQSPFRLHPVLCQQVFSIVSRSHAGTVQNHRSAHAYCPCLSLFLYEQSRQRLALRALDSKL